MSLVRRASLILLTAAALAVAGCGPEPETADTVPTLPAQAVTQLVSDLRHNDLAGYARHAVPPALHARLEQAWSEGRTVWPLTELPLDDRFPSFIAALAEQDAERKLVATYRRQFAGADAELRSAAKTVGLFAAQYVRGEPSYSEAERDHHAQLIGVFSDWAQTAPLGDSRRAREAIPQLVSAARATGLAAPDAFAKTGMDRSLRRLGPFVERLKQVLTGYGLNLDRALDSVDVSLAEQTGETARVRIRYELAGEPVDAYVLVQRIDGRWYLSDVLRHAQAEADAPAKAPASPALAEKLAAVVKLQGRPRVPAPKPAAAAAPAPATAVSPDAAPVVATPAAEAADPKPDPQPVAKPAPKPAEAVEPPAPKSH
ncbi:hypothetical protein [Pseudomonas sp. CGJS7]|uniref:hypothetical protein n=1 Tax=Pseudomonas sp. CGJS7 TaxID=3109348 RepID=UPI0030097A31